MTHTWSQRTLKLSEFPCVLMSICSIGLRIKSADKFEGSVIWSDTFTARTTPKRDKPDLAHPSDLSSSAAA